jgi:hypothetical protein
LRDVDWLSVFRNNAQEVRLFVSCRDLAKVPEGRLFEFHKNLFTLGFTVEMPVVEPHPNDDVLGEDVDDQNLGREGNGSNGQHNSHHPGNQTNTNQDSLGGGGGAYQPNQPNRTRMAAAQFNSLENGTCSNASAIFQLLVQKGVVDKEGCFIWEKSAVQASVLEETERFWAKDKSSADAFHQRLEDAVDKEIDFLDDIMPDFVSSMIAEKPEMTRPGRKLKKWGPVQPVRQSFKN